MWNCYNSHNNYSNQEYLDSVRILISCRSITINISSQRLLNHLSILCHQGIMLSHGVKKIKILHLLPLLISSGPPWTTCSWPIPLLLQLLLLLELLEHLKLLLLPKSPTSTNSSYDVYSWNVWNKFLSCSLWLPSNYLRCKFWWISDVTITSCDCTTNSLSNSKSVSTFESFHESSSLFLINWIKQLLTETHVDSCNQCKLNASAKSNWFLIPVNLGWGWLNCWGSSTPLASNTNVASVGSKLGISFKQCSKLSTELSFDTIFCNFHFGNSLSYNACHDFWVPLSTSNSILDIHVGSSIKSCSCFCICLDSSLVNNDSS